ncbi:MAG TPA: winged helix-turn-helix transcriptional regulator, partial [Cyclobacteriaceae bacterium]|nr:winged helix-turn-helix transcriptional regulator [Cyclobacteriaceae bacterium]
RLTKRRIEIMQAIADNPHLTLAQVADLLGIAESTLRNNLSAISRTLDTPNVNGAMVECLRMGLIQINQ